MRKFLLATLGSIAWRYLQRQVRGRLLAPRLQPIPVRVKRR